MGKQNKIIEKLGTEKVFLENSFEEIAVKSLPGMGKNWFAKSKGGKEYEINSESQVVNDAINEASEMTEQAYETY